MSLPNDTTLADLRQRFPRAGELRWIGVRPARGQVMIEAPSAQVRTGQGIVGDRYGGGPNGKRQISLIQWEHLSVIAELTGRPVPPALVRRNLAVSGINLQALNGLRFRVGEVLLEGTGPCHPCSRMEQALGTGGYNAMRGHGAWWPE